MGWEGPAHPRQKQGHLLVLVASLLLTCGPAFLTGTVGNVEPFSQTSSSTVQRYSTQPNPALDTSSPATKTDRSTDETTVSITNFPSYESSMWLKSNPSTPMTVVDSTELDASVLSTTMEVSQGAYGATTFSTTDLISLGTSIRLGLPRRSPDIATALKIISSKEFSSSPDTKYSGEKSSLEIPSVTVPIETMIGNGTIGLLRLPTEVKAPDKSPREREGMVATEKFSLSPSLSEAWASSYTETTRGTSQLSGTVSSVLPKSTDRATTQTSQQSSPELNPETTGMDFSTWLGFTGGNTMDTHISLSTSSTGLEDYIASPESTTTISPVTDKYDLRTRTWVSTMLIPSPASRKNAMASEKQTRGPVSDDYSSASPQPEQTSGSDLTLSASPQTTDILHVTSTAQTTSLVSLTSESQAIISLTNSSGRKMSSSSATLPSMGTKNLVPLTNVTTIDAASTPGQQSRISSPTGVNINGITTSNTLGVSTTTKHMGTSSILTTMPSPEGNVSTTDNILAAKASTATPQHPPLWFSTVISAPTLGPWTILDKTSNLEVTGSPEAISAIETTSSLAPTTLSGSVSTHHGPVTVNGTSLAIPFSSASGEKSEALTSLRMLGPSDTTASLLISASSGIQKLSTSVPDISSTSWIPNRTETEMLYVPMASHDQPRKKTHSDISFSTLPPDSLSTFDWAVGRSVSPATIATSAPQGDTTLQELPLETMINPAASKLPFSKGCNKSRVTPAPLVSSIGVIFSKEPDLTSRAAKQSSTHLPATTSEVPGHVSRLAAAALGVIPYTARTPESIFQGHGVMTPTAVGRTTFDSQTGKETASSESLNNEMLTASPDLEGTIKKTNSSGLLKTTDWLSTSLESETSLYQSSKNSVNDRIATYKPIMDREASHPSTNTEGTTLWAMSYEYKPHSIVTAHSESIRTASPMVSASTISNTIVSTSATTPPESTRAQTELYSFLNSLRDSSIYTNTSSTIETSIVLSPNSTNITKISGANITSSDRLSSVDLIQSTESSDVPTRPIISSFTSPPKTEYEGMTFSPETGPHGAISHDKVNLDTSTKDSWVDTQSDVIQGLDNTKFINPMNKGPGKASWTRTHSVEQFSTHSYLGHIPTTTSDYFVKLKRVRPTSTSHMTSLLTKDLATISKVSFEKGTTTFPILSSNTGEIFPPSEAAKDKEEIHPSTYIAATTLGTISYEDNSSSSFPAHSKPTRALYQMLATTRLGESIVSTTMLDYPQTKSISPGNTTVKETSDLLSQVPNVDDKTEDLIRRDISSNKTYNSGLVQSLVLPSIKRTTTLPVIQEHAGMTVTSLISPSDTISVGTHNLDTSTVDNREGAFSDITHDFALSTMTPLTSRGPGDASWTRTQSVGQFNTHSDSVEQTSTPSSPEPTTASNSSYPASPTSELFQPSSSLSITSLLTYGLMKSTTMSDRSIGPGNSSLPIWSSIPGKILPPSKTTTDVQAIPPTTQTAGTSEGSSFPAHSEMSRATSPEVSASSMGDTTVSTSVSGFSKITRNETEPMSPKSPQPGETSTSRDNSSTEDSSNVHSQGSMGAAAVVSKTVVPSSSWSFLAGPIMSPKSMSISLETSSRPSASPSNADSKHMNFTTLTGRSGATYPSSNTLKTSTTPSLGGTHLTFSRPSRITSHMDTASTMGHTTASSAVPSLIDTARIDSQPPSSMIPGLGKMATTQNTTTDMTQASSSSSTSMPRTTELHISLKKTTENTTSSLMSPFTTETIEMSFTTKSGPLGMTSQGIFTSETSTISSWAGTPSGVIQGYATSKINTLMNRSPRNASQTGSPSSLEPKPATSSTSHVPSTFEGFHPSSPVPATLIATSGVVTIPAMMDTNLESGTSSSPKLRRTSDEILTPPEATTDAKAIFPSTSAAATDLGTTSSTQQAHSFISPYSEQSETTTLKDIDINMVDNTFSTTMPGSSENAKFETELTSFLTPELMETSTSQETSSTTETSTVLFHVSLGATTTDFSKTEVPSSHRTFMPRLAQSTRSMEILTGTGTTLDESPPITESTNMNFTTLTGPPVAVSLHENTINTSTTDSWAGIQSVFPRQSGTTYSKITTSIMGATTVSTSKPESSETKSNETEPTSTLTPDMSDTSTSPGATIVTETSTLLPHVLTGAGTTEVFIRENISSSTKYNSGPAQSSVLPSINRTPTSAVISESAVITVTSLISPPEVKSVGTHNLNTSTLDFRGGALSNVTDDFAYSTMTPLMNRGPGDASWINPDSVEQTSTPSSPEPTTATNSSSSFSSKSNLFQPTSSLSTTSLLTYGLVKSTTMLDISIGPGSSSLPIRHSTSKKILSSKATTDTQAIPHSAQTSGITEGSSSSGHDPHFFFPTYSEISRVTSPEVSASSMWDTTVSTSMSGSSKTARSDNETISSQNPQLSETSTSQDISSTEDTGNVHPQGSMSADAEVSKTVVPSSAWSSFTGPIVSPRFMGMPSETSSRPSAPPSNADSKHMKFTTLTGHSGATYLSSNTLETSTAPSPEGTHLTFSSPSRVTSHMDTASTMGHTTVSSAEPASADTTRTDSQPPSSVTPGMGETSTTQDTIATGTSTVYSQVLTGSTTFEVSMTQASSSSRTSMPQTTELHISLKKTIEGTTSPLTSPLTTENTGMSFTTKSVPPGTKSQGIFTSDTSAIGAWAGTRSGVIQGYANSKNTTLMNKGHRNASWTGSSSVDETSSPSSLKPKPAASSTSSVSSTFEGFRSSSPVSIAMIPTSGMVTIPVMMDTSLEPGTSSPPKLRSTSGEILTPPEATTDTEAIFPSTSTETTDLGTTISTQPAHSFVPSYSERSETTTLKHIGVNMVDSTFSTTMPGSSENTKFETESTSLTRGLTDTSTSQETSSTTETSTVLFRVSPGAATTEFSRTKVPSSHKTFMPDLALSTRSLEILTESSTRHSESPPITESRNMTFTTLTGHAGPISLHENTLNTSTTDSWAGTQSIFPRQSGTTYSKITTSNMKAITVSTSKPESPEPKSNETEPNSTLTPDIRYISSSPGTTIVTETSTLLPHMLTDAGSTEVFIQENISSSTTYNSGLVQSSMLPSINRTPTSAVIPESAVITISSFISPPEVKSVGAHNLDSSILDSRESALSDVTHNFAHSTMTPLMNRGPGNASRISSDSVEQISTPSSHEPTTATTSSSSVSSTSKLFQSTSSLSMTSPLTYGLVKSTIMLDMSIGLGKSSLPAQGSISGKTLPPSKATKDMQAILTSVQTSGSNEGSSSSGHDPRSSFPAHSEITRATSSEVPASSIWDTTVSTSVSGSFKITRNDTETMSSQNPQLSETSTSQDISSTEDKSNVHSLVSMGAATDVTKTVVPSSAWSFLTGPIVSPGFVGMPSETTSRPSASSSNADSEHMKFTTLTGHSGVTYLSSNTLETSTATSPEGTHLTFSRPSRVTSHMDTASTMGHTTVSSAEPSSADTTRTDSQPPSSMNPGLGEIATTQDTTVTGTSTVYSRVFTGPTTFEVSTAQASSSSRTSMPQLTELHISLNKTTEGTTSSLTSSLTTESTGMSFNTKAGLSGARSQGILSSETSTTGSLAETPSGVIQGYANSKIATFMNRGQRNASGISSRSVEKTSFSTSLESKPAISSTFSLSYTFKGFSPSSPVSVTLIPTSGMVKILGMMDASLEPGTSSPPKLRSTSGEILTPSEATTDTEAIFPSTSTEATDLGATSSTQQAHSLSHPPQSNLKPQHIGVNMVHNTFSTIMPGSSENTKFDTESTSSPTLGLTETSTSQETSSTTETSTVIFNVSLGAATTEFSRTEVPSSHRTFMPGLAQSARSMEMLTGNSTKHSESPPKNESTNMTFTTTGPPGAISLHENTLNTSVTDSWAGIQSVFPRQSGTTYSKTTTSITGVITVSTPKSEPSETKSNETEPTSILTPDMRETSTFPGTRTDTETSTLIPHVFPGAGTTEVFIREIMPSSRTYKSSPVQSSVLPSINRTSTSAVIPESAVLAATPLRSPSEAKSVGMRNLDTSTQPSMEGALSDVTQDFAHSAMMPLMNRGPGDTSWISPDSVEQTSTPSSPEPTTATTSSSPVSSTSKLFPPTASLSTTSPLAYGLEKSTNMLDAIEGHISHGYCLYHGAYDCFISSTCID
ncbi:mucin-16-like [Tamandua tetradactyla]|uniref:mucin-16-like n=1 Tax=Tamandua tetradactyla TaxID=48850 RepID=UPI004053A9EF